MSLRNELISLDPQQQYEALRELVDPRILVLASITVSQQCSHYTSPVCVKPIKPRICQEVPCAFCCDGHRCKGSITIEDL